LPTRGPGPRVLRRTWIFGAPLLSAPPCLNRRSENLLYDFTGKRLAQLVLDRLRERHRVARDLHHESVEYGIVLPQEIRFAKIVRDVGDEADIRLPNAAQIDGVDLQAFLARRATGPLLLPDRAEEWVTLAVHRPLLVLRLGLRRSCGRRCRRSRRCGNG